MSTLIMHALSKRIKKYERILKKRDLGEYERRYAEFKLAEAQWQLWLQTYGWKEREEARRRKLEANDQ